MNLAIMAALLLVVETACYLFLPDRFAAQLWPYRCHECTPRSPNSFGRQYARDYFRADPVMGFDLNPDASRSTHWVDGRTYDVWTNRLGCFDTDADVPAAYTYLAGDSFAWGFTPFGEKFGTLLEAETGTRVLKCGVTHSGQRHQFDKMMQVTQAVGHAPSTIIVTFYPNDVQNDFSYPHSSVLEGWMVDVRMLEQTAAGPVVVDRDRAELEEKARAFNMEHPEPPVASEGGFKFALKQWTITGNILDRLKDGLEAEDGGASVPPCTDIGGQCSVYGLPLKDDAGQFAYLGHAQAAPNQAALRQFRDYAAAKDVRLLVVLIPQKRDFDDTTHFEGVRAFLDQEGIEFIDLTEVFAKGGYDWSALYWERDGHFNAGGNRVMSEALAKALSR